MRWFISSVPLFLPVVMLSLVLAAIAAPRVARWLRTRTFVAFLGLVGVATIVAATLTPEWDAMTHAAYSAGGCDVSRVGLIPLSDLTRVSQPSLNVALFVPLGMAIGLVPWSSRSGLILAAALLLPFVIEAAQAALPALGRGCESADVTDNLTGLGVGFLVGLATRQMVALVRSGRTDDPGAAVD